MAIAFYMDHQVPRVITIGLRLRAANKKIGVRRI